MATKNFRLGVGQDTTWGAMSEVDQTAATRTDGWTVGKLATLNSADFTAGTKRPTTAFSLTSSVDKPQGLISGNAFKSANLVDGTFVAGNWTLTFAVRATVASSQTGRVRIRVFRSSLPNGGLPTEITTGVSVAGTTSAALSTTADVTSVITWNAPTFLLSNEYLFVAVAWEIIAVSGNNSADVSFRTGQSAGGSQIVTTNYVPSTSLPISAKTARNMLLRR